MPGCVPDCKKTKTDLHSVKSEFHLENITYLTGEKAHLLASNGHSTDNLADKLGGPLTCYTNSYISDQTAILLNAMLT